jgi:hypothetical protein
MTHFVVYLLYIQSTATNRRFDFNFPDLTSIYIDIYTGRFKMMLQLPIGNAA